MTRRPVISAVVDLDTEQVLYSVKETSKGITVRHHVHENPDSVVGDPIVMATMFHTHPDRLRERIVLLIADVLLNAGHRVVVQARSVLTK